MILCGASRLGLLLIILISLAVNVFYVNDLYWNGLRLYRGYFRCALNDIDLSVDHFEPFLSSNRFAIKIRGGLTVSVNIVVKLYPIRETNKFSFTL